MPRKMRSLLLLLTALLLLSIPFRSLAANVNDLKNRIAREKAQAAERKQELHKLTEKERSLYKHMASLEDKVMDMEDDIWKEEQGLETIEKALAKADTELAATRKAQKKTERDLEKLLNLLWPLHLENTNSQLSGVSTWADADRDYTWLSTIYAQVDEGLAEIEAQSRQLEAIQDKQNQLKKDSEKRIASINDKKDALLIKKLEMVRSIQDVRAEIVSREQVLSGILDTIQSLNYTLKTLTSNKITAFKGSLPWPAQGHIVEKYRPKAKPPQRGIGIALTEGTQVRAVSWGKVVHNDVLRGFGKVIILYHGQDYYSLYAFLSDSRVRMGQEVEKDETIGTAGYYPKAKGSGLYFELRFHKKAINPLNWLTAAR